MGSRARTSTRRSLFSLALFGALAGLLLYSKLRVTTTVPRSAYAVPEGVDAEANKPKQGACCAALTDGRPASEAPDAPRAGDDADPAGPAQAE